MLTVQEPPLEEALDLFQFVYTADRAGTYVAPESTALFQFMILAFPKHLRRLYLEVYGSCGFLGTGACTQGVSPRRGWGKIERW